MAVNESASLADSTTEQASSNPELQPDNSYAPQQDQANNNTNKKTLDNNDKVKKFALRKRLAYGLTLALVLGLVGYVIWGVSYFKIASVTLDNLALGSQLPPPPEYLRHLSVQERQELTSATKQQSAAAHPAAVTKLSNAAPMLMVHFYGIPTERLSVTVDSVPVALEYHWLSGRAQIKLSSLSDGPHTLNVSAHDYSETCVFVIDTQAPKLIITRPTADTKINKTTITVQGQTDPGAKVLISSGQDTKAGQANGWGYFSLVAPIVQGNNRLLIKVYDQAGNMAQASASCVCDTTPPENEPIIVQQDGKIKVTPKKLNVVLTQNTATLSVKAQDLDTGIAKVAVIVDKHHPFELPVPVSTPAAPASDSSPSDIEDPDFTGYTNPPAERTPEPSPSPSPTPTLLKSVSLQEQLPTLYEGSHEVQILVTNGVDNSSKRSISFLVDSTEVFGLATLGLGARGQDVEELQSRLVRRGYLTADSYKKGIYDQTTLEAVCKIQRETGMEEDGIAGPLVIGSLCKRIYVNLSRFSAKLINEDGSVISYPICIGVPDHPTPTGEFFVADLAKNPSWLPPDEEWAKDAKVAPPGPNNPLGTRWIGLSCGNIGFHGTPYPDSVGSAASHGCMRMTLSDVEHLYDQVTIGTRVIIFKGNEDSPELHAYWP